ncbi:MAG TPA: HlyD family efflux transporter periplasmic adaptor subunit, partial [Noviherbaspirillum sp.]
SLLLLACELCCGKTRLLHFYRYRQRGRAIVPAMLRPIEGPVNKSAFPEIPLIANSEINELSSRAAQLRMATAQNDSLNAGVVRAPRAGVISMMSAHAGQSVMPGDQLMTIWPSNTSLEARVVVGSDLIGVINVGQEIFIRHRSYPYQKYGMQRALVTQVSKSPIQIAGSPGQSGYVVYAKLGDVEGAEAHSTIRLVPGMEFDADVLLERRTLLDWVLQPFRGFQARQSIGTVKAR